MKFVHITQTLHLRLLSLTSYLLDGDFVSLKIGNRKIFQNKSPMKVKIYVAFEVSSLAFERYSKGLLDQYFMCENHLFLKLFFFFVILHS